MFKPNIDKILFYKPIPLNDYVIIRKSVKQRQKLDDNWHVCATYYVVGNM